LRRRATRPAAAAGAGANASCAPGELPATVDGGRVAQQCGFFKKNTVFFVSAAVVRAPVVTARSASN